MRISPQRWDYWPCGWVKAAVGIAISHFLHDPKRLTGNRSTGYSFVAIRITAHANSPRGRFFFWNPDTMEEMNMTLSGNGQTVPINGMDVYYETGGEGEPLLLLHGGGGIGANWQLVFTEDPPGYKLIVPDLRGHGRSTNPSMKFTFRQSGLDVLALMDHLGIKRFKAIGLSLGAKTLLHVGTLQQD